MENSAECEDAWMRNDEDQQKTIEGSEPLQYGRQQEAAGPQTTIPGATTSTCSEQTLTSMLMRHIDAGCLLPLHTVLHRTDSRGVCCFTVSKDLQHLDLCWTFCSFPV